ncbi:MAG: RNA 2',3'-cyclic phosphodiesterase [Gammaproteobacteria bacterium]|nr:RNA 2',3'-cyclic phosphodiesterase [Pseudomonadales bacterium]
MNPVTRKRLFIGIAYQANAKATSLLQELQQLAGMPASRLRPVVPENLHITLRFLGLVPEPDVVLIRQVLQQAVGKLPGLELRLRSIGFFRQSIWLGVEPNEQLHDMVRQLNRALNSAGFAAPDKPYVPHLTVARLRSGAGAGFTDLRQKYVDHEWDRFPAGSVQLYESNTLPEGVRYRVIDSVALTGCT